MEIDSDNGGSPRGSIKGDDEKEKLFGSSADKKSKKVAPTVDKLDNTGDSKLDETINNRQSDYSKATVGRKTD